MFFLICKLYETWTHSCSSRRAHSFVRYLRSIANIKVSVFGYSNLRQIPREWILCDVCMQTPPFLQDASGIDTTVSSGSSTNAATTSISRLFHWYFQSLKNTNSTWIHLISHLSCSTSLFPWHPSTFCYCETRLPCYLTGQNINCSFRCFKLGRDCLQTVVLLMSEYLRCAVWNNFNVF